MLLHHCLRICLCAAACSIGLESSSLTAAEPDRPLEWLTFRPDAAGAEASLQDTPADAIEPAGFTTFDVLPHDSPPATPLVSEPTALMLRPMPALDFRWEPASSGLGVKELSTGVQIPGIPFLANSPAVLSVNANLTDFDGIALGPFYRLSAGLDWQYQVSERLNWTFNLTPALATDFNNVSGDMLRIRASALAQIQDDPNLQWLFGVILTGREDIPILPAAGAVMWLDEETRLDLFFPRPRISKLIYHDPVREQWLYAGGELGGGTWAAQLPRGRKDAVSYRAYRLVFGVEFVPAGTRRPANQISGHSAYIETGLSFGRRIEFEHLPIVLRPNSTFYLGGGVRF